MRHEPNLGSLRCQSWRSKERMFYKELLSAVATALTFVAFFPYVRSILDDTVKPHVLSWVIWGSTTFIVFLAQMQDQGGVGAWPIGISGCIAIGIALLALLKRSDLTITTTDWVFFVWAMSSLPFWFLTSDPLWAVVVLTTIDVLGFGPTIRKAYSAPHTESLMFFSLFAARNVIVVLALEHYSVTTVLFPATLAVACALLVVLVAYRRHMLGTLGESSG